MVHQTFFLGLVASVSLGVFTVMGVLSAVAWSRNRSLLMRLAHYVEPHLKPSDASALDARLEHLVGLTEFGRDFLRDLRQLRLGPRPGRLLLYGVIVAGAAYVVGSVRFGSNVAAFGTSGVTLAALFGFVRWRAGQSWKHYRRQLPEALHVISSALSAGASLSQALKHAARETVPPLQGEIQRVVEDVEVGKTLEQALTELTQRLPLPEFDMVIASLLIQQRSGGNLAELLNETAQLIKQNEELRQEMGVLTSQAQASARLIGLLPVGLFAYLYASNRSFLGPLLDTGMGNMMLIIAFVCEIVGYYVVSRIATFSEFQV